MKVVPLVAWSLSTQHILQDVANSYREWKRVRWRNGINECVNEGVYDDVGIDRRIS
jgi:hypothetical protein